MTNAWKLSPSDFAFLWEECKRCFYLKIVRGFQRPRPIMPKIFTIIDSQMKSFYSGKRTEEIAIGMPHGVIEYGEKWVESRNLVMPNKSSSCFIRGRFDTVVHFDDGTFGVVDFKTSARKAEHVPLYARQLHAYAQALEKAVPGKLALSPISKLGLLVYEPNSYSQTKNGNALLEGSLSWIEIPREDDKFMKFLSEVISVLELPEPPGGSPTCEWCQYRDTSRRTKL
jgi:hypothetical protein